MKIDSCISFLQPLTSLSNERKKATGVAAALLALLLVQHTSPMRSTVTHSPAGCPHHVPHPGAGSELPEDGALGMQPSEPALQPIAHAVPVSQPICTSTEPQPRCTAGSAAGLAQPQRTQRKVLISLVQGRPQLKALL